MKLNSAIVVFITSLASDAYASGNLRSEGRNIQPGGGEEEARLENHRKMETDIYELTQADIEEFLEQENNAYDAAIEEELEEYALQQEERMSPPLLDEAMSRSSATCTELYVEMMFEYNPKTFAIQLYDHKRKKNVFRYFPSSPMNPFADDYCLCDDECYTLQFSKGAPAGVMGKGYLEVEYDGKGIYKGNGPFTRKFGKC